MSIGQRLRVKNYFPLMRVDIIWPKVVIGTFSFIIVGYNKDLFLNTYGCHVMSFKVI